MEESFAITGTVYLVGAGPGDPDLLTLRAARLVMQAGLIVHDGLVSEEILAMAGPKARLVSVAKRRSRHSMPQPEINALLVAEALAGKDVVRLKGGDPFVFGRGGEEALTLVEHGIPFRIVPGISAGIGGLAYAGIPVTHRDINHSVTFLTGHDAGGIVPDAIDWQGVAKGSPVIVMYMAMKHWPNICARLMEHGLSAATPVAFVCNATLETQQVLETTLGQSEAALAASGLMPPAIVVVGDAVKLRKALDWRGALAGRKLDPDPLGRGVASRVSGAG